MERENIYVKLARIEEKLEGVLNNLKEKNDSIKEISKRVTDIELAEPDYRNLMKEIYAFMLKQSKLLEEKNKEIEEAKTESSRLAKEWKRYVLFTITGIVITWTVSSKTFNFILKAFENFIRP
jgi:hypothetical protein